MKDVCKKVLQCARKLHSHGASWNYACKCKHHANARSGSRSGSRSGARSGSTVSKCPKTFQSYLLPNRTFKHVISRAGKLRDKQREKSLATLHLRMSGRTTFHCCNCVLHSNVISWLHFSMEMDSTIPIPMGRGVA